MLFMTLVKGPETFDPPPPMALIEAIEKQMEEGLASGILKDRGGLHRTARSARIRSGGGKLTVIDGPFAETKEVIGGYAIYDLPSLKDAVALGMSFMELHRQLWPEWEGEVEIRPLFGPDDMPGQ
jgi:hypothetical protein